MIDNLNVVIDVAREVRLRNIAVSIDDVGADWPALMGLETFPFAELKVDRQFVTGCANDRLKQTVCRSIIELARGYGVRVVAEGIETRADFVAANEMGFDLVQGYLFGKPDGAQEIRPLRSGPSGAGAEVTWISAAIGRGRIPPSSGRQSLTDRISRAG